MTPRIARALALAALLAAVSAPAAAQVTRPWEYSFAAGAGGSFVNDTGPTSDVKTFSTGEFHAFWEVVLDPGVLLQLRYQNFLLPGSTSSPAFQPPVTGPPVRVNAGTISVGYLFRETWWEAGFYGGWGVYGLSPRTPEAGQVPTDISETVTGWHGGVLTLFQVARRVDVRLEASGILLRSNSSHKPILLGASVAYHF